MVVAAPEGHPGRVLARRPLGRARSTGGARVRQPGRDRAQHLDPERAGRLGSAALPGRRPPGPGKTVYQVPALAEGEYFFFCELHPGTAMEGTITVAEGAGGARVVAQNTSFDTEELHLPAETPTTLTLDNQDAAPHNLSIYEDDTASGEPLFTFEPFTGPAEQTFDVEPIPEGEYYFRCDVHRRWRARSWSRRGPRRRGTSARRGRRGATARRRRLTPAGPRWSAAHDRVHGDRAEQRGQVGDREREQPPGRRLVVRVAPDAERAVDERPPSTTAAAV